MDRRRPATTAPSCWPDPIDYIRRFERMLGVRNAYAFYVIVGSMSPAIEHGDQVVVNPNLPVRPALEIRAMN